MSNYPTSLDSYVEVTTNDYIDADHLNEIHDAVEVIEAKIGKDSETNPATLDYLINNFFVSGRKMWFYENGPAPVGWTIVGTLGGEVLAVKGGSTYAVGGTTAGSWSHSHSFSHTHGISTDGAHIGHGGENIQVTGYGTYGYQSDIQGGHNHGGATSGTQQPVSTVTDFRPLASVGIMASKD